MRCRRYCFPLFHNSWAFITDYFFFILKSNQPTSQLCCLLNVSAEILLLSRLIPLPLYCLYLLSAPAWIHSSCHKQGQVRHVIALLKTIQLISNSGIFNFKFLSWFLGPPYFTPIYSSYSPPKNQQHLSLSFFIQGMHWGTFQSQFRHKYPSHTIISARMSFIQF